MAVAKPTLPEDMDADELLIGQQLPCLPGDRVFLAMGSYDSKAAVKTAFASQTAISTLLTSSFLELGELAEKAIKLDSKPTTLKTRHNTYGGKRTTTLEIYLAGLGQNQKDYLESSVFQDQYCVLAVLSEDHDRAVILNGIAFVCNWTAQDDAINAPTLSAEFAGTTKNRIVLLKDIPAGS